MRGRGYLPLFFGKVLRAGKLGLDFEVGLRVRGAERLVLEGMFPIVGEARDILRNLWGGPRLDLVQQFGKGQAEAEGEDFEDGKRDGFVTAFEIGDEAPIDAEVDR